MKTKFSVILLVLFATIASAGCHAQVPKVTPHQVQLTWTAPSPSGNWGGCTTSAPCVYAVYRCSASAATCADTTNVAWTEITTSATRPSGTSFTDTTATGTVYYNVETVQGTSNSAPSNIASATVPASPLAPSVGNPAVSANLPTQVPDSTPLFAMVDPLKLKVKVL